MFHLTTLQTTGLQRLVFLCVAFLFFWSGIALSPAFSQEVPPPPVEPKPGESAPAQTAIPLAPVQVDGRTLFQVIGVDEADALRRADRINRRLERLINRVEEVDRFQPEDVVGTGNELTVVLGGEEIITVTQADVEYELAPASELAQRWGMQLSWAVRSARFARSGTLPNIGILTLTSMYDLVHSVAAWLPRLLGAVVLALLFWLISRMVRWTVLRITHSKRLDPNLRQLAIALAFYGTWTLGIFSMLTVMGVDSTSIATTLGVSGFILGFAFKDVLSHFFAGLMLLMGRQLSIGGQITVGEFEGVVESVDLRALHLRTFDNRLVTIPNGEVFNSAIIANTRYLYRRRSIQVGIGYEDDAREAIRLALGVVKNVPGVLAEPAPQVVAVQLGISAVELRVYFYISTRGTDPLAVESECFLRIKEKFAERGIRIPLRTQTLELRAPDSSSPPSKDDKPEESPTIKDGV